MKRARFYFLVFAGIVLGLVLAGLTQAQDTTPDTAPGKAFVIDIQGPIGPATRDFISRSLERAAEEQARVLVIRLDTPGGLDASTRDIIKDILQSPVPVVTWVAPEGARAASAGTYMLYASHVAAMSPATNVGAATPVAMVGGQSAPGQAPEPNTTGKESGDEGAASEPAAPAGDTMMRKTINDSVAYIRGLAELRGRNADWAEQAVREAVSITSAEAEELGVIDLVVTDIETLLARINGLEIEVQDRPFVLDTTGLDIEELEPDWRNELLSVITSPTLAYILLLVGVYGLVLEGYNPGAILPGVVGAISLLLALYALQMLPVNYVGLALIGLGVILMIAEVLAPSFGVLGFGGIVAMVIGSIILIDTDVPGFAVSKPLIGAIAVAASLGMMAIVAFALKARERPVVSGREQLLGASGTAEAAFTGRGEVFVHGETWAAFTETPLAAGQSITVTGRDGLVLHVTPAEPVAADP
ncbi:MAG: nodulation protein NfeD [Xanthomonadales bacterium]|nr:nodulation protein NfeD [Xanthomonadales bacterium]